ncbi:glycosyltransferase family 90 protein [Chaetomium sp. MPI-SDFR-AT-0129]|nr:glycosyltransferase family 90 protein [Chaetomium sp. MPI-SDFR-AT-0129]
MSPTQQRNPFPFSLPPSFTNTASSALTAVSQHIDTSVILPTALAALASVAGSGLSRDRTTVGPAGELISEGVCWGVWAGVLLLAGGGVGSGKGLGLSWDLGLSGIGGRKRGRAGDGQEGDGDVEVGLLELENGNGNANGGPSSASAGAAGRGTEEGDAAASWSVWAVAVGLVVAALYRAELGDIALFPVLTPLLLLADRRFRPEIQRPSGGLGALAYTAWGTALVAVFGLFALLGRDAVGWALVLIPMVALFIVYAALIPRSVDARQWLTSVPELEEVIVPLAGRVGILVVVGLGAQAFVFGIRSLAFGFSALLLGLLKAGFWYFTVEAARNTSWVVATAIGTFGLVASRDPYVQLSNTQAFLPFFASLLVLAQVIYALPSQTKGRMILWALFLIPFGPYLANIAAIRSAQSSALHSVAHPIEVLARSARSDFKQILDRQSKTYSSAIKEYQRRYGVEPPQGFKEWYEFVVANESPIIDEFDAIHDAVAPFWKLSGDEVQRVMDEAYNTPGIDLWLCSYSSENSETTCKHPWRGSDRHIAEMFSSVLGDLHGLIPDTKFLVNHLDEPRVLFPHGTNTEGKKPLSLMDLSEQPTWDAVTKYCPTKPERGIANPPLEEAGLPLVANLTHSLDLCKHPEYATSHGLFQAPASFKLIEGLVPVLSTGSPSTLSDILIPSPAYLVESEFQYNPASDIPFSHKASNLYWTGSTTGGVSSASHDWHTFHRQRFLTLAQNLDHSQHHTYLHQTQGSTAPTTITTSFLNTHHYHVSPTRIFQCATPLACRQQRAHFRTLPWQPADAAFQSQLAFDLDGNGISGRFYKLLASHSAVLKQTLLREWHDERLKPWVHYVPVSMGMGELPETVSWLVESARGRQFAEEVAREGREWMGKGMRGVDVKAYLWRLVLELARVGEKGRGAIKEVE